MEGVDRRVTPSEAGALLLSFLPRPHALFRVARSAQAGRGGQAARGPGEGERTRRDPSIPSFTRTCLTPCFALAGGARGASHRRRQ